MNLRLGLCILDGLMVALLVARLIALKRTLDRYRPPSPLPPAPCALTWEALTVVRVS